jgi:selenocysteine-specific elongation factor
VSDVSRGSVLAADAAWQESRVLRAEVTLLPDRCEALGPRTRVRFHLGTHDVGARIVATGGTLLAGSPRGVRVVLDAPVIARAGDRFVLRGGAPLTTIGGGIVADPMPEGRRVRPWSSALLTAEARLAQLLAEAGTAGIDLGSLPVRLGLTPRAARQLLGSGTPEHVEAGSRIHSPDLVAQLVDRVVAVVSEHHERFPLDPGAPLQAVRSGLGTSPELADVVIRRALADGLLEQRGATITRFGWRPTLTADQGRLAESVRAALDAAGWEPPSVPELEAAHGSGVAAVLRMLEREGAVVKVEDGRYYGAGVIATLGTVLREGMESGRSYGPAELRELLGVSRKYLIPLLEYCDKVGLTDRRADGRVLRGT